MLLPQVEPALSTNKTWNLTLFLKGEEVLKDAHEYDEKLILLFEMGVTLVCSPAQTTTMQKGGNNLLKREDAS